MADNWRKVAIVLKDPADSGSTGGIVKEVKWQYANETYNSGWEEWDYHSDDDYECIVVDDDSEVQVGWIKRDKTGEIVSGR